MKKYLLQSVRLTLVMIVLLCVIYPMVVAFVAKWSPGGGGGESVVVNGKKVGYERLGQTFDQPQYFWGRPSAVTYNAAGSAGSNKAPSNGLYLKEVQERIDTLKKYHPGLRLSDIPADLITASGSGLDPDISIKAARLQAGRIAVVRKISREDIERLIEKTTEGPFLGFLGPQKVNVLKLNLALDRFDQ